jgi:hypothetical protein
MNRLVLMGLGSILALAAVMPLRAQAPNTLTPEERTAVWRLLFDGKTMNGWDDPSKKTPPGNGWTIEDGCIKPVRRPGIREDLVTRDSFGDFELTFEWKISAGGNSGVKYRIQDLVQLRPGVQGQRFEDQVAASIRDRVTGRPERGEIYAVAFEYQVIDNTLHADARRGPKYQAAALYDMVAAEKDATKPVGEFNQSRIVLRGDRVEHWLNGQKVVDASLTEAGKTSERRWTVQSPVYRLLTEQPKKRTPVAIQHHGDEAWFRNIKIRPLD